MFLVVLLDTLSVRAWLQAPPTPPYDVPTTRYAAPTTLHDDLCCGGVWRVLGSASVIQVTMGPNTKFWVFFFHIPDSASGTDPACRTLIWERPGQNMMVPDTFCDLGRVLDVTTWSCDVPRPPPAPEPSGTQWNPAQQSGTEVQTRLV